MPNRTGWLVVPPVLLCLAAVSAGAAEVSYVPQIKIMLEVRTPQGDMRTFSRPGSPPMYWAQDMPVVQGDKLTAIPVVITGGAELDKLVLRLDNDQFAERTAAPWRADVDTAKLAPGYHSVEAWAVTKAPDAKDNSGATTFLVVPSSDPLLAVMQESAGPPATDEERLACVIRSRDPQADASLASTSSAKVTQATLFFVLAGPAAKEYYYTITRDGQVNYTSFRLPMNTHIQLQPQIGEGPGQAPGDVILTVRAGDGQGRFGAPVWVTVQIEAPKG